MSFQYLRLKSIRLIKYKMKKSHYISELLSRIGNYSTIKNS